MDDDDEVVVVVTCIATAQAVAALANGVRFATVKTKKHSYNKKANHRYIYPVLAIVMHNNG
ncbi:hypothetical protein L914_15178 [Phytophthora nicotianae]|uniref:Uncharacterized protein n=2 Tax=Phytophthora nicotianae TaxID=4792 RepID=V9EH16_PHYNI|nr:hypothetical protein F443_15774 [Phytophthora nicotianae P1569]ETM38553.1 hypothetical protein L914_15178 [Phytophthora nicotianae]